MILRCTIKEWSSGDKHWMPLQIEDKGKVTESLVGKPAVFLVMADGTRKELRKAPYYHQLIPCPYCGTEKDSSHIASEHMINDPRGDGCIRD